MAAAAKRLAITPRIASKTGFVDVSNATHGSKFRCFGSTAAASGVLKEEKESKKISKLERRATLEAFVNQYRASNAGRFPTASYVRKQIGGSYYIARQIIQELEFNHKMSLVGKHNGSHLGKTKQDNNPAMLLKEVSAPSEVEKVSKPIVSENCVSSNDIDRRSKIRTKDNTIANVDQMVINDELLDRKEPSVSATVETSSVKKAVKYAHSTSRQKSVGCTENSSINGVASSGTHTTTNVSGIGSTSRLANESLQDSVHDYKRDEVQEPSVSATVETSSVKKAVKHAHSTSRKKSLGSTENSSINGVASSGTHTTTNVSGIGSTSRLANESLQDSVHDYKRDEVQEPSVSATVETSSVKKAVKHTHSTSRKKTLGSTENSSINGVASSGTHTTTNVPRIGSTSRLANESAHDSKRDEADLSVSLRLETTVDTYHLSHSEEDNKNRKSTEHLHDTNGPKHFEQIENLEAPESEGHIGDPPKKARHKVLKSFKIDCERAERNAICTAAGGS
ncbi:hypothetical protein J5N97_029078 [Dioscorea zingiberensis]|uniref:AT3G52170-like helix-turn-helix domain-containing protein n=1 Tax=Dioscorea zingiberensis TaxID=325984 RepID=A0A9D5C066_9LILI|nr:hypothetical protein J5N97_029078 [Dioscorea zingiberensis]